MKRLALYQPSPTSLLVRNPMLWAAGIALASGTAALAGVMVALLVLGGTVGTACVALHIPRGRRWSARLAQRVTQRVRRDGREARLEVAGVHGHELAAATLLVDEITAIDPTLAAYMDLEALLDRYAELEIRAKRYERVMARPSPASPVPYRSARRARLRDRSEAMQRTFEARLADGRDELAGIVELLQFLLQRSVLEATEPQADPVGDCLALLED